MKLSAIPFRTQKTKRNQYLSITIINTSKIAKVVVEANNPLLAPKNSPIVLLKRAPIVSPIKSTKLK